jgi:hypothetical protein
LAKTTFPKVKANLPRPSAPSPTSYRQIKVLMGHNEHMLIDYMYAVISIRANNGFDSIQKAAFVA